MQADTCVHAELYARVPPRFQTTRPGVWTSLNRWRSRDTGHRQAFLRAHYMHSTTCCRATSTAFFAGAPVLPVNDRHVGCLRRASAHRSTPEAIIAAMRLRVSRPPTCHLQAAGGGCTSGLPHTRWGAPLRSGPTHNHRRHIMIISLIEVGAALLAWLLRQALAPWREVAAPPPTRTSTTAPLTREICKNQVACVTVRLGPLSRAGALRRSPQAP